MAPSRRPASLAKARGYWRARRFVEALREYGGLLREKGADLALLMEAAQAFAFRRQAERALTLLEKGVRQGARQPDVLLAAGRIYESLNRWSLAETCYQKACRLSVAPMPRLLRAQICERRHELDEARELAGQALRVAPDLAAAHLLLAQINRRSGKAEQALASLQWLVGQSGVSAAVRADGWGLVAEVHDQQGDSAAAWDAIERSKAFSRAEESSAWAAAQFVVRRFADYAAEFAGRGSPGPVPAFDLPDSPRKAALLTGFPRSGTTLLEQALDAHPGIVATEEDEFFGTEILPDLGRNADPMTPLAEVMATLEPAQIADCRQTAWNAWDALHDPPIGERLHLDKNPAMILAVPVLRRLFPELRLVVALRDPRDVILSCYLRRLPVNPVSVWFHSLERAVERYRTDMEAWLKLREVLEGWVEIRYEDTVADFPREVARAVAGLGLPWDASVLSYRDRLGKKQVKSPTYADVAKPLYSTSIGRWRRYEAYLAPTLKPLDSLLARLGYA